MALNVPFNEERHRRFVELHLALQQRNPDQLKRLLVLAGSEYPADAELENFRHQLSLMEHAANVANTLLRHGRRKIQSGYFETGLAKLQQAHQIDPSNREIEALLFDTLVDFAKIDCDPERAQKLLHEAAEISPLNLRLEGIRQYVADRTRQPSGEECLPVDQPEIQTAGSPIEEPVVPPRLDVREAARQIWHNITAAAESLHAWVSAPGLITRSRIAYAGATGVACLVLVLATAMIGRSGSKPELMSVGTGTLLQSVTLVRGPSENSGVDGALKIGQQVELLQQIPETALDAWTLIRSVDDPKSSGYVRLQNLERVQTGDRQFDLWVAMSLLDRSSSSNEFRKRLENVEQMLKTDPPVPSREADQIFLTVSKAFARLASESTGSASEFETTRLALANSEAYLKRIEGALRFSDDAETLQYSIPRMRAVLEQSAAAKKPPVARARRVSEETRILRLAKAAYSKESYETAAKYCTQVLKINGRNAEARKLLANVRRAQKDLAAKLVRQ